jgi:hypothetical protein
MAFAAMSGGSPFFADAGLDGLNKLLGKFFVIKAMAYIFIAWLEADKSPVSFCFQIYASP